MLDISLNQDQKIRYLIRNCGQKAQKMALEPLEISEKGPNDYVTNIDQCLDRQLTAGFIQLFPQDGIITEENPLSRTAFNSNYQQIWCIDPLDGTEDFIQKKLYYSVMVGLLSNHQPIAGWIYAPTFDKMCWGGKDWGLFQTVGDENPQPLTIASPPALSRENCKIILGDKDQKNFGHAIAQQIPGVQFYSLGSFGLKVLEIIEGKGGLYLYFNGRVKLWDTVGPLALAKAAGLICCDLDGEPLQWTADSIEPLTLTHKQTIAIGWPEYIERLLPKIRQAVQSAGGHPTTNRHFPK
jgi:3'(2'), 5'-bisphosphate nucleotidase